MHLRVDLSKLVDGEQFLRDIKERIGSDRLEVPLETIALGMRDDIRTRITTAGASDGRPLAPHASKTTARHGSHPVLQLTGAFLQSIRHQVYGFEARVSGGPAANLNEWGTKALSGGKKNPARPVMWVSDTRMLMAAQTIVNFVVEDVAA